MQNPMTLRLFKVWNTYNIEDEDKIKNKKQRRNSPKDFIDEEEIGK